MAPCRKMIKHGTEAIESCDQILTQILQSLPAKSFICSKLVSRIWLSLISDPFFRSIWKPRISGLFIQIRTRKTSKTNYKYIPFEEKLPNCLQDNLSFLDSDGNSSYDTEILSSCNGLFLILCTKGNKLFYGYRYNVYNPTTKEYAALPCPERSSTWEEVNMLLAYDTSDSKLMEYKVIAICSSHRSQNFIHVYTSESKSWKSIERAALGDVCFNLGVFFDGSILWPALRSEELRATSTGMRSTILMLLDLPQLSMFFR